jgi:Cytochrome c7 and related cytochrome c
MPQVFHRSFNTISRVSIFGAVFILAAVGLAYYNFTLSDYATQAHIAREQPVPFSHQHHAGQLGIDCRYCHTSVETSSFAGLPPTKTCMNCHQEIWFGSTMLEPVRASYRNNEPIVWQRVHNLAQFVYFDHSVHVAKGVGCASCHGRVDTMPLLYQENSLLMEWCLGCHRDPAPNLRPRDQVFNMKWEPPADQPNLGQELLKRYAVRGTDQLTSCSTCHR